MVNGAKSFDSRLDGRLKLVELNLNWPEDHSLLELRAWILEQLRIYGDPLRWAITAIRPSSKAGCFRQLKVEAVLIISRFDTLEN